MVLVLLAAFLVSCAGEGNLSDLENDAKRYRTEEDALEADNFNLIAENPALALYYNPATTEISVKDKSNGHIWYSNPQGRHEDEGLTNVIRGDLSSQLELQYITISNQSKFMNNFTYSVDFLQFAYEVQDKGVRVNYTIGKEVRIPVIPEIVDRERFDDEILPAIEDDSQRRFFKRQFALLQSEKLRESEKDLYLEKFPIITEKDVYVLRPNLQRVTTDEMEEILEAIDYGMEEMLQDHADNDYEQEVIENEVFNASIIYSLEDDGLRVTVPRDSLSFPEKFKVVSLRLLRYFGSQGLDAEGYMLIPDGSGAIINLNNGMSNETYTQKVYGLDESIEQMEKVNYPQQASVPVFGIKAGDNAMMAVIEQGDALAHIRADVSGRASNYNYVYSTYNIMERAEVMMGSRENKINMYQNSYYDGDISVKYRFLSGEHANYSGMALLYRDHLISQGAAEKTGDDKSTPFFLDLIGAIDDVNPVMGVPVRKVIPLTTYSQAQLIVDELLAGDVKNLVVKYSGWQKNGLNNLIATKVKPESKLGSQKSLNELRDHLQENSVEFFPDVDFQYVRTNNLFDSFYPLNDSARYITKSVAMAYNFDPAAFYPRSSYWILSPSGLEKQIDSYLKSSKSKGYDSMSLATLGKNLNSDYNRKNLVHREAAKAMVIDGLEKIREEGNSVLLTGANAYTLPYTDYMLGVPYKSSNYKIADESVPFLQIAYQGLVDFAGSPVNLDSNPDLSFLHCLETGSNPYFQWMYNKSSIMKDTSDFTHLYSVNYKEWIDYALDFHQKLDDTRKIFDGSRIVGHEIIEHNVNKTIYANGAYLVVNYNSYPVEYGGVSIDALSYIASSKEN